MLKLNYVCVSGQHFFQGFVATFRFQSITSYVIQVEDEVFCVPRSEFIQSSEAFADMFFANTFVVASEAEASKEGQDRENPIVLEGYKKDEFARLLKVMYPEYVLFNPLW